MLLVEKAQPLLSAIGGQDFEAVTLQQDFADAKANCFVIDA